MKAQLLIAVIAGIAAIVDDLRQRHISNWIPLATFAAGLSCLAFSRGWAGVLSALGGGAGGFAVFLIFYLLGGMGGGDVKLMAALGAVVGMERVLPAALWTAVSGGLLAVLWLTASFVWRMWRRLPETARVRSIPYAPAIALGSCLALLPDL